ncbi:MAG: hypothetical protein GX621_02270, partial [Pirellulaceae bacterium]|nr:hypothetical protein [Pirellulaceae bacterium]
NAGTGQFLIDAEHPSAICQAVESLGSYLRQQSGGEIRLAYGFAPIDGSPDGYRKSVGVAHSRLRQLRETAFGHRTADLIPLMLECDTLPHLPATSRWRTEGDTAFLSEASRLKRAEAIEARRGGQWAEWLKRLEAAGPWPERARHTLRPHGFTDIGNAAARTGYIGLVYADGNSMGRLVQELDQPDTTRAFSKVVDESVREACYAALGHVFEAEISEIREAALAGKRPQPLPADILLLGGDDLVVVLPADKALTFALVAMETFERAAVERIEALRAGPARDFFEKRLPLPSGPTISCGVAISRGEYPFYLLLELAEELLRSAKRAGSEDSDRQKYRSPAYLDFHMIAGSSSHNLEHVRATTYRVHSEDSRTCRPLRQEGVRALQRGVEMLRSAKLPRSKLHDLLDAALTPSSGTAEYLVREIFSRCRIKQRQALWSALEQFGDMETFPWGRTADGGRLRTALADLVEAVDLFPLSAEIIDGQYTSTT